MVQERSGVRAILRSALLEIELVTGSVRVDGAPVQLPEREHALLFALARRDEPVPRETLFELLWPALDEPAARNALNVCMHRLRARLGGDRSLVSAGEVARLRDDVHVDLWEIERTVADLRKRESLSEDDYAVLRSLHARLDRDRSPRLDS